MAFSLLATAHDGTALRLQLTQAEDRLASRIDLLLGDRAFPLLESVEGQPLDPWPPSPPWQHCQPHPHQTGVILTTGMAGNSHWSASIESQADPSALVWDVACRARLSPVHLGSVYRVPQATASRDGNRILLQLAGTVCRLHAEPLSGSSAQLRLDTTQDGGILIGARLPAPTVASPQTFRWKYRLERVSRTGTSRPGTP